MQEDIFLQHALRIGGRLARLISTTKLFYHAVGQPDVPTRLIIKVDLLYPGMAFG